MDLYVCNTIFQKNENWSYTLKGHKFQILIEESSGRHVREKDRVYKEDGTASSKINLNTAL